MKKDIISENDHALAYEKFKGRASVYQMRLAEYAADRIESSIPKHYKPLILDDGRIIIEIESAGEIEVRCKGNEKYDTLVFVGSKGDLSLEKRIIAKGITDTLTFINAILSSFDAVQGVGSYQERNAEPDAQDAAWEETHAPLTHIQKLAGIQKPKEESEIEYFKSTEEEAGNPTDAIRAKNNTSLYDLSAINMTQGKPAPSAGKDLFQQQSGHTEVPEKKKMQDSGNVVRLAEGVKVIKVNGRVGYYTPQGVQWLPRGTIVERVTKKLGYDNKAKVCLREVIEKI
jgi:hypothetical protein